MSTQSENLIPAVKHVVLVGSGKGGVGKSTVAVNLAVALAETGARTGLLDADIYGPSIPIMMGSARPTVSPEKKLIPIEAHGLKVMSIGYLVDASSAMIWRGPMLNSAVIQLLRDVAWGELDYLLVDLPPGTGDVQLTIAQNVSVTGAVVVTTPQAVAVADVVRAKNMFDQVSIHTLGVIENMSSFVCPSCNATHPIFATGGGERSAHELGIEFLGSIPIDPRICESGDSGAPLMISHGKTPAAEAYRSIVPRLMTGVEEHVAQHGAGQIPIQVVDPKDA
ncbi:MAG: Mrp/NBP35 family ATP-binding protein [Candidatus Eiseniibacteriota bacterium]